MLCGGRRPRRPAKPPLPKDFSRSKMCRGHVLQGKASEARWQRGIAELTEGYRARHFAEGEDGYPPVCPLCGQTAPFRQGGQIEVCPCAMSGGSALRSPTGKCAPHAVGAISLKGLLHCVQVAESPAAWCGNGLRNARAKGARIGRPQTTLDDIPANFLRHYPQYKNGAFNLTELARLCDVSRTTAYKYNGLLENQ